MPWLRSYGLPVALGCRLDAEQKIFVTARTRKVRELDGCYERTKIIQIFYRRLVDFLCDDDSLLLAIEGCGKTITLEVLLELLGQNALDRDGCSLASDAFKVVVALFARRRQVAINLRDDVAMGGTALQFDDDYIAVAVEGQEVNPLCTVGLYLPPDDEQISEKVRILFDQVF